MTTTIERNRATTTFRKAINVTTPKGTDVVVTAWWSKINVTADGHKTKTYFDLTYKGKDYGHYRMDRGDLNYYMDFVDKYKDIL